MFSIDMGGCDIVLGIEWLHTLGPILMDFKDLIMQFELEGQQYNFQGITTGSLEIIIYHRIKKILKKVIDELYPNSTPFMLLRHLLCILNSNLSSIPFPIRIKLRKLFMNY
jgi:hypothetical protein